MLAESERKATVVCIRLKKIPWLLSIGSKKLDTWYPRIEDMSIWLGLFEQSEGFTYCKGSRAVDQQTSHIVEEKIRKD